MQVTLTMRQALDALGAINGVLDAPGIQLPRRFAYALARNQAILDRIARAHEKAIKADAAYQAYEAQRVRLAKEHAEVKDGRPVMRKGAYVIVDPSAFNEALEELQDAHRPAVLAMEDRLDEPVEPDGRPLDAYAIPDVPAFLPGIAMRGLHPLLDEAAVMAIEDKPAAPPAAQPATPAPAGKGGAS